MLVSTLFTLFGLGALCWILFNLAVYALPFAIGLTCGMYLYESGQGVFLSIIAGLFIGGFIAAVGEFAFDRIRSIPIKLAIGLIYAIPAGITGFHAAKGLAEFGSASAAAITILSWLGALVIGGTAWARVTGWSEVNAMSDPHPHRSFNEH
ncbi:hypothetical protein SAMN05421853_11318 [Roseivivax halotolerans]|uniref:Uncharacterized protein n=1 Tax=Roseivivax halotolerans TaxID=93684 RepID=A0A1I5ZY85_9RHOB|nr:hypothetical protein [Roseivivax halotolerans]SFQ61237.1 hypothetical protein SAMN05421853_11318 [Roseivivax halotolerans]